MGFPLARLVVVYLGVVVLSRLYVVFITEMGLPGSRTGAAYWGMSAVCLLLGLAAGAERLSVRRVPWGRVLVPVGLLGLALFRASPQGYFSFGVSPWANSWVPPVLAVVMGVLVARELRAP